MPPTAEFDRWLASSASISASAAACSAAAFNVASRREVLKLAAVGLAPLAPLAPLPVYAKGKRSMELAASEAEEKVCASPALIMKELPCTVPSCTYG